MFLYNAKAHVVILALKRKDRYDLIMPFARWMLRWGEEIFHPPLCSFQFPCIGNGSGTPETSACFHGSEPGVGWMCVWAEGGAGGRCLYIWDHFFGSCAGVSRGWSTNFFCDWIGPRNETGLI